MGILDVDRLLGQEPDPLAAAAVNLTQAAGQNPQEHIERRKLSNASGVPAALMDDPEVRERARRDAFARELYLREHPATAGFAANPNNAPLITDDIVNLKEFEDKTRTLAEHVAILNLQVRELSGGRVPDAPLPGPQPAPEVTEPIAEPHAG